MYSKAATTGQLQWMWASVSVHSAALNKLDQTKPMTTWAIKKLAQWLRISGGSRSGKLICQLYQAQAAVAISTNTSPSTNCTWVNRCQSPRHITSITPMMDITAPIS